MGAPSVGKGWGGGGLCGGGGGQTQTGGGTPGICATISNVLAHAHQSLVDKSSTCSITLKDSVKTARVEVCNSTKVSSTQHSKSGCKVSNIRHCVLSTCSRHYLRHLYPTRTSSTQLDLIYATCT